MRIQKVLLMSDEGDDTEPGSDDWAPPFSDESEIMDLD